MFSKFLHKQNIRRVVPGTCLVAGGTGAGASPAKVTLSLKLRGGCWRPTSRKVAVFTFQEASGHASSYALLDLEYLFRCSSKPGASDMQVKICVKLRRGGKRVARADLEEFLGQLLRGGRLDSFFLYIHEEKVALLQANQSIPYPATEWLFEGEARGTHTGVKAEEPEGNGDTDELEECNDEYFEEWKAYLEKVFSVEDEDETDEVKNFNDDNYDEWKAYLEEVFAAEDEDETDEVKHYNDDNYEEWQAYLEEVFAVDDDNEAADEATCKVREASGYDAVKLEDDNDDCNKEGKANLEEVFAVENDDEAAGEATSEVEEASGEGNEAAGEATSEVEEASGEGNEAAGEATSEVEEASGEGNEAAGEATSEVEEASGEGNEAAGEATSEVEEVTPNGTMAADEDVSSGRGLLSSDRLCHALHCFVRLPQHGCTS
ncbi:retinitis pigmentosa 1-like 1 protein isoform X1 [Eriocheir sinensis]|uniref:retinitis pigmentosa 1-like 1 protein isoform X1 n=1 Tax=Eriocheir sinensis TaxID=95602 RepID=UPI0021C993F1|nr:retinitis pigmentosa 1-like 1 protein isoform X1 [Eriocheir sinensis]